MTVRKSTLAGREDHIRLLREKGLTCIEAAEALGVTVGALSAFSSSIGVSWKRKPRAEEYGEAIASLAKQGLSMTDVAKELGVSQTTVSRVAKELKIRFAAPLHHKQAKTPAPPIPKPAPRAPLPDLGLVRQAMDFMRRRYPTVYREKTLGVESDLIICGSLKLTQNELVQKAKTLGFNPEL